MIQSPRTVEEIAGPQRERARRRTRPVLVGIKRLAAQRQFDRSVVQGPQLRPRDLKHEHVMTIEVRLKTLRTRRRKVNVRLKIAAKRCLDGAAEIGKARQALVQLGKGDRGPGR